MQKILIGAGALLVVIALYTFGAYNNFVTKTEAVANAWAQVETQYQRRFDLIPNLVESVKATLKQEQEVFGAIADARTRYAGAKTVSQKVAAANQVESALGRLLVIMENYPQLRSVEAAQTFMSQLEGTENRISVERNRYNERVQSLNISVKRFPSNIIAGMFGFEAGTYFESIEGAETAPKADFNL